MWKRLVRGTEWSFVTDLVSPSFFDVVPGSSLRHASRDLLRNWRDRDAAGALRERRDRTLEAAGLPLRVGRAEGEPALEPAARGELLVALYFHQLFADDAALLDLRHERFGAADGGMAWDPKPLFVRWDPAFLEGIREVYAGFYEGDEARFERGLRALGMEEARDTFVRHFGEGDQRAVRFEMKNFTDSFHQVFVRCRDEGIALHADFVPLGLYLATMYDHLEPLDVPIDVRAAYERAVRRP